MNISPFVVYFDDFQEFYESLKIPISDNHGSLALVVKSQLLSYKHSRIINNYKVW